MDFTNIYKKYSGKWIALDKTLKKVISYDADAAKALKKAIDKGVNKPTLFKVPEKNIPYVGFSNEIFSKFRLSEKSNRNIVIL